MGVQQSRRSKSRTRKKRSMWARLDTPTRMECPQCHEAKMPHRVCPSCGFYKNREAIKVNAAE
ncbi:LSU ribosomal protein L32P [Desulfonispora thiosulfatigenes DSM 11270]|uniref:Large ribosomal subunit protein bL32 n=1 Tax=Desulfonispora thiosulfatigenes DSM 11270 TaxID=656914 RepID=A0A1W1VKJ0_DESTI|nr:50S ribosomal protein L32 [Desulfonispora thiosulfatigenes]SMB93591.1 LSU ribosomal protein L32P [Desulfonispora thiosulfatigenes DSM 11270]